MSCIKKKGGGVWAASKSSNSNVTFMVEHRMGHPHNWNAKAGITKYGFTEKKGGGWWKTKPLRSSVPGDKNQIKTKARLYANGNHSEDKLFKNTPLTIQRKTIKHLGMYLTKAAKHVDVTKDINKGPKREAKHADDSEDSRS